MIELTYKIEKEKIKERKIANIFSFSFRVCFSKENSKLLITVLHSLSICFCHSSHD